MRRFLAEPLLHFLVLGAALFGLFGLISKNEPEQPAKIVVSAARIENLANGFVRMWQRPPNAQELAGLIDDYIRDEVFYREGKALGLDRDDIVIRRRLRQKLEFVAEDMAVAEPSDQELAAYLASHADRFRSEDRLTFRHVFLNAARRPSSMEGDAKTLHSALAEAGSDFDAALLGDDFLLGQEFRALTRGEAARTFGARFAEQVFNLEPGGWHGPVASSYGLHFVTVSESTQGALASLDAVRPIVRREWMNARRLEAEDKLHRTLRARYEIVVEEPQPARTSGTEPAGASGAVR